MQLHADPLLKPRFFRFSNAWQGAFWKIISCACFAGMNGIVRYWSSGVSDDTLVTLPVNVMIFFQNAFGTALLLPWILKLGVKNLITRHPALHCIRVVTAVLGIYLWYLALQKMPITESVALNFTGPIFTVIGAWILLHEKLNWQRLLAIVLTLIGAFLISRPDIALSGGDHPIGFYALLPLSSALLLAFNKLLTRKLANLGETPSSLAIYLLLLMLPVSFIPALYEWQTPNIEHWPWLILLGALAAAAHLSFGKAYQLADVTFLMPFGFSKLFLSALVGYIALSEFPTHWTLWMGVCIIFLSIILIGYKISLYSIAKRFRSN